MDVLQLLTRLSTVFNIKIVCLQLFRNKSRFLTKKGYFEKVWFLGKIY